MLLSKSRAWPACILLCTTALHAQVVRTSHYDVHSALPADATQQIAEHLEAVHAAYARGFASLAPKEETGRTPVYVLGDQRDYLRFLSRRRLGGSGSGGLFSRNADGHGLVTFKGERPLEQVLRTLRHEGFHRFAHERFGTHLPLWLNEGLAEYFAESILVGKKLLAGQAPPDKITLLQSALEAGTLHSLGGLFALDEQGWNRAVHEDRARRLYPQAWSVVHFLIHGPPKRRAAFGRYLGALAAETPAAEAFAQAFDHEPIAQLEQDWRLYARALNPTPALEAARRLEFLGHGLKWAHAQKKAVGSVAQLREAMRRVRFRLNVSYGPGASETLDAKEDHWFEPPAEPVAAATLTLLEPPHAGTPPGLVVRGLAVTVRLQWKRDARGGRSPHVAYEPAEP